MRTSSLARFVSILAVLAVVAVGCADSFAHLGSTNQLVVTLQGGMSDAGMPAAGSPTNRLPLTFVESQTYTLNIEAHRADGTIDPNFNGFVRLSVKPGTVLSLSGPRTSGRNAQLVAGVADNVQVAVVGAYGDARIWAEDIGYVPADPTRQPPPECSDGIDNNNNGLVDFPVDPGCAFANDDTEDLGSYATGVSDILYYHYPRVADVRGIGQGGAATPFPNEQVEIDTQWNGSTQATPYGVVVTRVASDGFFVTDIGDCARGDNSLNAYNYSPPPTMRVCDRLIALVGTASDFHGFTELGFPAWVLEEWDPTLRPCLVPEPHVFLPSELGNNQARLRQESALVRVMRNPPPPSTDPCHPEQHPPGFLPYTLHVGAHIGANHPDPKAGYAPTTDATNCDFNGNGKVDYVPAMGPEALCAAACAADVECSEYSGYLGFSQFNLVLVDHSPTPLAPAQALANASTSQVFDPVVRKGQDISSFTGTLKYFSGGSQFTIEARCDDDIVTDVTKPPLPSDKACVSARTIADQNTF